MTEQTSTDYVPRAKIPVGTSIPIRETGRLKVPDIEKEPGKHIALGLAALYRQVNRIATMVADKSRPVDEYNNQTLAPESNLQLILQPQWEVAELIESIVITGPSTPTGNVTVQGVSTPATDPGANTVIASISGAALTNVAPAGSTWEAEWVASLQGTIAAGDANNMNLISNLATKQVGVFPGVAGDYPQEPVSFVVPGGAGIQVQNPNAASGVSAVYDAQLVATLISSPAVGFQLQLGDRTWNLMLPASGILVIPNIGIWLNRDDPRILTATVAGQWGFELMGHADTRGNLV